MSACIDITKLKVPSGHTLTLRVVGDDHDHIFVTLSRRDAFTRRMVDKMVLTSAALGAQETLQHIIDNMIP